MKLNFVPTIGGRVFYLGDDEDENAPMVKLEFCNEFAQLPEVTKKDAAEDALLLMARHLGYEQVNSSAPPASAPRSADEGIVDELVDALEAWVNEFNRAQAALEPGDPLREMTRAYHARRVERSIEVLVRARGGRGKEGKG